MRIPANRGVSSGTVTWLREQGHDAVHLHNKGPQRLPNGEIFTKTMAERRTILTFDLDFGEIVALSGKYVVSVVVFRLNNTRTPFVKQQLASVLPQIDPVLQEGAIVITEDSRHRIRRLPPNSRV